MNRNLDLKWVVAGAAVLAAIGAVVWWVFYSQPPPAWRVRAQVVRFLKKHSLKDDFQTNFRFPAKEAMKRQGASEAAAKSKPALPARDFDSLASEYLDGKRQELILERELNEKKAQLLQAQADLAAAATNTTNHARAAARVAGLERDLAAQSQALTNKRQQLEPLLRDLWAYQRAWSADPQLANQAETNALARAVDELLRSTRSGLETAPTYAAMYALIGQELWVAERLFRSAHPDHRRAALNLARQAAADANRYAENPWLAARIYQGYILPHLELAEVGNRRAPLSLENLVGEAVRLFTLLEEPDNVFRAYQTILSSATTPQRRDWARVQLSQAYERNGDYAQALRYLKQVELTNDFSWALRRVPWLQDRLKSKSR